MVLLGTRIFTLFDDAMISMRYARNLAQGHGLVWNIGSPPIEGYTNLLWVLYMAMVHLFPVPESKLALVVQLTGLAGLGANLLMVRKLAQRLSGGSRVAVWFAIVLTAFYLPLNNWALQGTEVSVLALITTASLYLAVCGLESGRTSIGLYGLLGIATLLRIDAALLLLAIVVFLFLADHRNRWKHAILGSITLLFFVGGQTLFRLLYYGQLLPNTYYLKLTGFPAGARVARGAKVFWDFVYRFNPVLFLLPFAGTLQRPIRTLSLLLWVFCCQCAYSIYIGGDAWEAWGGANRFICIVMPIFFVLMGITVSDAGAYLRRRVLAAKRLPQAAGQAGMVLLLALCLAQVNLIRGDPKLAGLLLLEKPMEAWGNVWAVTMGPVTQAVTTEDATIAVVWAGSLPYFSHRPAIDLLGRNDARIARGPVRISPDIRQRIGFYPGHMKWDYAYSIGELRPDVVSQLWGLPDPLPYTTLESVPPEARPYIEDNYLLVDLDGYRLLVRKDSPRILWPKVNRYIVRAGE